MYMYMSIIIHYLAGSICILFRLLSHHTGYIPRALIYTTSWQCFKKFLVASSFSLLEFVFSMMLRHTNLILLILCATVGSLVLLVSSFLWQEEGDNGLVTAEYDGTLLQDDDPFRTSNTNRSVLNTEILQQRPSAVLLATLWFGLQWLPSISELLSCPSVHDGVSASNLTVSCKVTSDMSLYSSSDAVVFHARDIIRSSVKRLASLQRPANQRWVMFIMESPLQTDPLN